MRSRLLLSAALATTALAATPLAPASATPAATTPLACLREVSTACYSPIQLEHAYGATALYDRGFTGRGVTVAVINPYGSPTLAHDLHVWDRAFGLPDPPSLRRIEPAGPVAPFDPDFGPMVGWGYETTLDVMAVHALAPEANIISVATPTNESEGASGFADIVKAENYVIDHHLATVISQSLISTENTFSSRTTLLGLRSAFVNARRHHVTMIAASGDWGPTGYERSGNDFYPYRVVGWPASDPLVTAVGGTRVNLDLAGHRTRPDVTWNEGYSASGGGRSTFFARPAYQDGVRGLVGSARGIPDISMLGSGEHPLAVYTSFDPNFPDGWRTAAGSSLAAPLFAGVVALAVQYAHRGLGLINPALYRLATQTRSGIVDVTKGNTTCTIDDPYFPTCAENHVPGFAARRGYDLATGWGTVDAATFVPALAAEAG